MLHRMHLLAARRSSPKLVYNREYACHQMVMAASDGETVLWVDLAGPTKPPLLRVLSSGPINIPAGWVLEGVSEYPIETVEKGETFAFRIKCNPTIRREGKRFAVWTNEEGSRESAVGQWLAVRAERNGFELIGASTVFDVGWVQVRRGGEDKSKRHRISFATATITGQLNVTDTTFFQQALINGIGPQKAFGCGLMLVKRI